MAIQELTAALQRTERVLRRRPSAGLHDDSTAVARWRGGTRVVAGHANGQEIATDMPRELGGEGREVTPGWLVRAGLATCSATAIAMAAAAEEIELTELEVRATSRSDLRGVLGMAEADGTKVYAGLMDVQLHVRVAAPGVPADRLRALVERSGRNTPMLSSIQQPLPVEFKIEVGDN